MKQVALVVLWADLFMLWVYSSKKFAIFHWLIGCMGAPMEPTKLKFWILSSLSKSTFINLNSFILVLQKNSLHFTLNRVKWYKQILPSMGSDLETFCIWGKRLTVNHNGWIPLRNSEFGILISRYTYCIRKLQKQNCRKIVFIMICWRCCIIHVLNFIQFSYYCYALN